MKHKNSLAIAAFLLSLAVRAGIIAEHREDMNPARENWIRVSSQSGKSEAQAVQDNNIRAWRLNCGTKSGVHYKFGPSREQNTEAHDALLGASECGWTLSINIRVADVGNAPNMTRYVDFVDAGSRKRWGMDFGSDSQGNIMVALRGDGEKKLTLGESGYHVFKLVFDPKKGTSDLFVDDTAKPVIRGYRGDAGVTGGVPHLRWGSISNRGSGMADYNSVIFTIAEKNAPVSNSPLLEQQAPRPGGKFEAGFVAGSLVSLVSGDGVVMVKKKGDAVTGAHIGFQKETLSARTAIETRLANDMPLHQQWNFGKNDGLSGMGIAMAAHVLDQEGDMLVEQLARSIKPGVVSVGMSIGHIPLDMNIIVPGAGGVRLTRNSPEERWNFSYPMGWEAQLVIIEGKNRGFYLWAEDAGGGYKQLSVARTPLGWVLKLSGTNAAPYAKKTECRSPLWHLNVYTGDWRGPARRYREWAQANFNAAPLAARRPSWLKDVRTVTYAGQDITRLETLAEVLDPAQTMLYLHHWRFQDFDVDYPDYAHYAGGVREFIKKAHDLGFRIMLHLNAYGVDPKHPFYEKVKHAHVHESQPPYAPKNYRNTRTSPPKIIAYINPASKVWRDEFVRRAVALVGDLGVDGLHLDQNFHAHNDNNGLIDGMTYTQGVVAFHQALHDALPDIALGGEGLNEMTYRHTSYAQRHVYSVMRKTIDRSALMDAHPISSYLFQPHTRLYGWLGIAAPDEDPQVWCAWMENYRVWGAHPTPKLIRTGRSAMLRPSAFLRQSLEETQFWQAHRVEPDLDGAWPDDVLFPWKTGDGSEVRVMRDRSTWLTRNGRLQEISRTVSDARSVTLPGTIAGWKLYDKEKLFGLEPEKWYPYFTDPRPLDVMHMDQIQDGFTVAGMELDEKCIRIRTMQIGGLIRDLSRMAAKAKSGIRLTGGAVANRTGAFGGLQAASFSGASGVVRMSPPAERMLTEDFESDQMPQSKGLGETFAVFKVNLPKSHKARFRASVGMDGRSIGGKGLSDGVIFTISAKGNGLSETKKIEHTAMAENLPVELDLAKFSGEIEIELSVHPGAKNNATEDRAIWHQPRVEENMDRADGVIVIANAPSWLAQSAKAAGWLEGMANDGKDVRMSIPMPGEMELNAPDNQ
jgi:hypothetical protein